MSDQGNNQNPGGNQQPSQPGKGLQQHVDKAVTWCKQNPVLAIIIVVVVLLILWAIF